MGLRINQNIMAMNSYRNLTTSESQLSKSLEKLSSGFRINKAADDASGLVISEGLRSQVRGLKMAIKNTQDGVSVVQTAEGALTEVHSLLQRIRELAVQASSTGSSDPAARAAAQAEVTQLVSEVDRIGNTTRFGGQKLLDGSYGAQTITETRDQGTAATADDPASITGLTATQANWQTLTGVDNTFYLDIGGGPQTVTVASLAGMNAAAVATALQTAIDSAVGSGNVTVSYTEPTPGTNAIFSLTRNGGAGSTLSIADPDVGSEVVGAALFDTLFSASNTVTDTFVEGTDAVAGSFAPEGGHAAIQGDSISALTGDYTVNTQTFQVSTDGGTTYTNVVFNQNLTLGTAAELETALQTVLDATAVSGGFLGDSVTASVIYDEFGNQRVELRTVGTGESATLHVRATDGADADTANDAIFGALFNEVNPLEASGTQGGVFQVGADAGETIGVAIRDIRSAALGTETDAIADIDISTDASGALAIIDAAITQVSTQRGDLGAIQNRFEHTIANLSVTVENLSASESRIRDTDMAEEMMSFTRAQILQQAGTAMLAQANAVPQSVLQLLQ